MIKVRSSMVLLVIVVVWLVVYVPLWLIALIGCRMNHIYTNLVGWLGRNSCLWGRR